jgi:hypothetical protein
MHDATMERPISRPLSGVRHILSCGTPPFPMAGICATIFPWITDVMEEVSLLPGILVLCAMALVGLWLFQRALHWRFWNKKVDHTDVAWRTTRTTTSVLAHLMMLFLVVRCIQIIAIPAAYAKHYQGQTVVWDGSVRTFRQETGAFFPQDLLVPDSASETTDRKMFRRVGSCIPDTVKSISTGTRRIWIMETGSGQCWFCPTLFPLGIREDLMKKAIIISRGSF